jgi:peroxiredoxin
VLEKLSHELRDKGLLVVGMDVDDPPDKAREYVRKSGFTYTILLAESGKIVQQYEAKGLPVMMLVGRDGKIIGHWGGWAGEAKLRARLKQAGIE